MTAMTILQPGTYFGIAGPPTEADVVEVGIYGADKALIEAVPCSVFGIVLTSLATSVTWDEGVAFRPLPSGGCLMSRSAEGVLPGSWPVPAEGDWSLVTGLKRVPTTCR